jgi:hypothetical protein
MNTKKIMLMAIALAVVLVGAAFLAYEAGWLRPTPPNVPVEGGEAGLLPRATAAEERLDSGALDAALDHARKEQAAVLLIARHGHLVTEYYGHGIYRDALLDTGAWASVLAALAAGDAITKAHMPMPVMNAFDVAALANSISAATDQSYVNYLSTHLWRRINAAPARFLLDHAGAAVRPDCCFEARAIDWLRVAELLMNGGRFEGIQAVPETWIKQILAPAAPGADHGFGVLLAKAARGAATLENDDVVFLRGAGHDRLWMVPSLRLAVLVIAPGTEGRMWDETQLPNLVMAAVKDRPPSSNSLNGLVPGH